MGCVDAGARLGLFASSSAASAAAYNSKDAGACYTYGILAKRAEVVSAVERLSPAYGDGSRMIAHGRVYIDRIGATARRNKTLAANQLVQEGRASSKSIGVL